MSIKCRAGSDAGSDAVHLEEYLKDAELQGLTDGTLQVYESDLKHSFEFFDADPRDIDRHDLRDLLFHLKNEHPEKDGSPGVSPSTINSYFSALNSTSDS